MSDETRESSSNANKRIAKNTILLYVRMIIVMCVSLFTSRIILQLLGEDSFGIYNVIGGVVAMFSIFSSSIAMSISRFLTYELGKDNRQRLRHIFSNAVTIQCLLALAVIIIAEPIGIWFINTEMVISPDKIGAAHWVLQFSLLTFAFDLIYAPYLAAIIAHEKMGIFAYISLYEVGMKLVICYLLFLVPGERLVPYALMFCVLALSVIGFYMFYCRRHFEECRGGFSFDKSLVKEIGAFAGWSSFTMIAFTCYTSGINIMLNLFFGPAVNAARGVSVQVQNAVQGFAKNFQTAINPQIIKNCAAGEIHRMYKLMCSGTKLTYFLMLLISLPIIIEADTVLHLWLTEVPEWTAPFVRIILCIVLVDTLAGLLYTAQQADGNIKRFQLITGSMMLLILPIGYISLKMGADPPSVFIVYLAILSAVQLVSIFIVHRTFNLPVKVFLRKVILRVAIVTAMSLVAPVGVYMSLPDSSISSFLIVCVTSVVWTLFCVYVFGLENNERDMVKGYFAKIKNLLRRKVSST